MSRNKTVIRIQICEIAEVDGQDIMEKVIVQDCIEFTSVKKFLKFFIGLWNKAMEIDFKFL